MSGPVLLMERLDDRVAVLTLNRPERRNALTIELMESLCGALETLAADPGQRVVILRGTGPVFCAGLDLIEAADFELAERSGQWVARTFEAIAATSLVTIVAAHGAAYAGGAGLLGCCDFVVASDDLRICLPEVRRGLVPALASVALVRRLRDGDLWQLVLLGEPVDAARALNMGLVDRVVATDQLMGEARTIVAAVLNGAPEAIRQTKRLLRELRTSESAATFASALEFHRQARTGSEASEGLAAFRERREPRWK